MTQGNDSRHVEHQADAPKVLTEDELAQVAGGTDGIGSPPPPPRPQL
jgi:bacteriocin-like protein